MINLILILILFQLSLCENNDDTKSFLERFNGISWEIENSDDGFRLIDSDEVLMFSSGTSFYNTAVTDQAQSDKELTGFWPCKSFVEGDNFWIGNTKYNFKILENNFNEFVYEYRIEDELIGQYKYTSEGENLRCLFQSNFKVSAIPSNYESLPLIIQNFLLKLAKSIHQVKISLVSFNCTKNIFLITRIKKLTF